MTEKIKHNHEPNFGRKVEGCQRCNELKNGAKPVVWNTKEQRDYAAVRRHLDNYCFCADTPIYVDRCSRCDKPPYTN